MFLCPKCGAEVPDDSSFCQSCGAPLAKEVPQPQENQITSEKPVAVPVKKSAKGWTIALGIVAALLLACNIVQFIMGNNRNAAYEQTIADNEQTIADNLTEYEANSAKKYREGYAAGKEDGRAELQKEYSELFTTVTEDYTEAIVERKSNTNGNSRFVNTFIKIIRDEFDFDHCWYFDCTGSGDKLDDPNNYYINLYNAYQAHKNSH